MTLIIYAKCKDASIIISDRKETLDTGDSQPVKKYYIPENKEYILSLSGNGTVINSIISILNSDKTIDSNSIQKKLHRIIRSMYPTFETSENVNGFLLVREKSSFRFYDFAARGNLPLIVPQNPNLMCYGTDAGIAVAKYFLRKNNIEEKNWNEACKCLIVVMDEIGQSLEKIGNLNDFGFDILVIDNSGKILEYPEYKLPSSEKLEINFTLDPSRNITSLFKDVGISEEKKIDEKQQEQKKDGEESQPHSTPKLTSFKELLAQYSSKCTSCGKTFGVLELADGEGRCRDCSPTLRRLSNIFGQRTCVNCGAPLNITEMVGNAGRCRNCRPFNRF